MKKYYSTFDFTETREEAEQIAANYTRTATPYQRKAHPAHITPWTPNDNSRARFVVWTSYARY